ncbi:cytoplasm to vacuole targeting protein-like protein Vps64 [Calycina marina]|uniref:Cytoplasm to vacuole targeting protein-like protein Vps64 n=1 Tax=Calycina marina TaxID=1763456 RepID=A0A9P7YWK7_9HELO|nr:cytoplasm to vacuole targeting protein-like protein Vps64 [Calycina marina]
MTAVASPPSFQQSNRVAWGTNGNMNGISAMNGDEVSRMFMPRKSAQRTNSSSSLSSNSSTLSSGTLSQPTTPANGTPMSGAGDLSSWGTTAAKKKPQRGGGWPASNAEAVSGVNTARPQSILGPNGASTASTITSIQQPVAPSQQISNPAQQANGNRPNLPTVGEGNPVLYLLSMNGTFERKSISVPYYPDSLRIGRQTNAKTLPTSQNGFFDSKVLSRQHAEIWAERNGKVFIRDVKSSNGTFVNGARLSPENRESEPHELQSQDHLELGIDIVSEDQKTVVHHKVAAKVEYSGFIGATNNVLDMNFGDLDPANGAMMVPSQGPMQMRSRAGSQGLVTSNGRMAPPSSVAGSQMSLIGQQRPVNFWLTPVTTEQIVKRLTHEMRVARLQCSDLGRTDHFVGALLTKENVKEAAKISSPEPKAPQINGGSLSLRTDAKTRFSEPPAPPPQQPLPEKPDATRTSPFDPSSPASLKRSNTEKARILPTTSPIRQESTSQILSLVEALASAKKELDEQSTRMRDLEEMLQEERRARQLAEEVAKRLEPLRRSNPIPELPVTNGHAIISNETGASDSALQSYTNGTLSTKAPRDTDAAEDVDTDSITASTLLLEQRIEMMAKDMQSMRENMELFKVRAEVAEADRDRSRSTLAELVEEIRSGEVASKGITVSAPSPTGGILFTGGSGKSEDSKFSELLRSKQTSLTNGTTTDSSEDAKLSTGNVGTLSRPPGGRDSMLYHTGPYASMIGVVLIGMGLMAYLNGWQPAKPDR